MIEFCRHEAYEDLPVPRAGDFSFRDSKLLWSSPILHSTGVTMVAGPKFFSGLSHAGVMVSHCDTRRVHMARRQPLCLPLRPLYSPCAHECVDRPNLPCPACDWSDAKKFQLGQIVATLDVLEASRTLGQSPMEFLWRHVAGDWGDVDEHDRKENELSVRKGQLRIKSVYTLKDGTKIWFITEADRSVTTLSLPEEDWP